MPELKTLYAALVKTASDEPEKTALIYNNKRISYHNLLTDTDRAVDMFWSMGVRQGDNVVIALRNRPEFIISYFALSKIGAVAVPVNFLISKRQELEFILSHCNAKVIITEQEFLSNYEIIKKNIESIKFLLSVDGGKNQPDVFDFRKLLEKSPYDAYAHNQNISGSTICTILYTSGTTGNPKGVILTNENLLSNATSCISALDLTDKDVFLCILPMFHTFSWTATVVLPLILGCKIVIVSHITPAGNWLNAMGRYGVTIMAAVPQLFAVLSKQANGFKKYFLQYWAFRKTRFCVSGAAPLGLNTLEHFEKKLKIPLLEGYGLTETSPVVSVNRLKSKKSGSVGLPIGKVQVKIIDENHNELTCKTEGEICVKGVCVTKGYFKDTKATDESFTPDGWLKTGDIGTIDENGYLYICDRKKDMIINKGLKVFPAQVEAVFLKHPAVEECAVVGISHKENEEVIYCFCVPRKETEISRQQLMQFAKDNLDPYKRPREIKILNSLPKNALNKVLKRKLRQDYSIKTKPCKKVPLTV